jgi:hypothetical protein
MVECNDLIELAGKLESDMKEEADDFNCDVKRQLSVALRNGAYHLSRGLVGTPNNLELSIVSLED